EFGFIDDGVTDNDAAWALAKVTLGSVDTLVMLTKATGVFYFATTSDFTGLLIDASCNPTFTGPGVYNDRTQTQKANGDPAVTVVGTGALTFLSATLHSTFRFHGEPVDKFDWLTDGNVAHEEPTVIDMTTAAMNRFSWPNGNTLIASSTGVSKAANLINIDWSAAPTNTLIFAGFIPEVGCQYSWASGYNATDVGYVVLYYNGGYHAIYAAVGGAMTHKKLTAASTFTEATVQHFGDGGPTDV
ncbi:hypothetical protein, partial [Mesorhizobium sp. P5_C1]